MPTDVCFKRALSRKNAWWIAYCRQEVQAQCWCLHVLPFTVCCVGVSVTRSHKDQTLASSGSTRWHFGCNLWIVAPWQRRGSPHSHYTCRGDVAWRCLPDFLGVITNPLLTALPCHLNQLWVWAPDKGRTWVCAHGNTAHSPINACAVVFAVGLKCVPVVIPDSIEDTSYTNNLWKERKREKDSQSTIKIKLPTNSADVFLHQAVPWAKGNNAEMQQCWGAMCSVVMLRQMWSHLLGKGFHSESQQK